MGRFMIVSKEEQLEEYKQIAKEYAVSFEINDFYNPEVLDNREEQQRLIEKYKNIGLPEGSTMHGVFFDIVVFSYDAKVRRISEQRMEQSMEIAKKLGVRGVVFHTNCNPMLSSIEYDQRVVDMTVDYLERLLKRYPEVEIYLENMFDADPMILSKISEKLCRYENYGVCLDYAHASISNTPIKTWVAALSPYVKHIHINDNDLERDLHLAVGAGQLDWGKFVEYYRSCLSSCSVLIETTTPENQRSSLQYLERNFNGIVSR